MDKAVREWIRGLSDAYIIQWANRGLFRRGSRLSEKIQKRDFNMGESLSARLERFHQKIEGAGFPFLHCSCPAPGPCHHIIAALLALRRILAEMPETLPVLSEKGEENPDILPPWLIPEAEKRRKILGKAHISRAMKLMMQAVPIRLEEDQNGLTAFISDTKEHTVRIPRAGGWAASLCTCNATRCAHRALAVLSACRSKGFPETDAGNETVLSSSQENAIAQMETWLKNLVIQGISNTSAAQIRSAQALATLARQTDLPKPAAQLQSICRWLTDEKSGAAHVRPDSLRFGLTAVTACLKAIRTRPMPRPFPNLAGVHARKYRKVRNLHLMGAGAEAWESPGGFRGFTLYLYEPERKVWYSHSQLRPLAYADETGWKPERAFFHDRWPSGPAFRDIPGHKLSLITGWVSPDHRISAREETRSSPPVPLADVSEMPVQEDFREPARIYTDFLSHTLFSAPPFMPVLMAFRRIASPVFDPWQQVWSQYIFDSADRPICMRLDMNFYHQTAIKNLETNLNPEKHLLFGMLSHNFAELTLRPVSILSKTHPLQWQHLTLPEEKT